MPPDAARGWKPGDPLAPGLIRFDTAADRAAYHQAVGKEKLRSLARWLLGKTRDDVEIFIARVRKRHGDGYVDALRDEYVMERRALVASRDGAES